MELLNGRELVALICDENHFTNLTEDVLKVYVRQVTQGTEYTPNKGFKKSKSVIKPSIEKLQKKSLIWIKILNFQTLKKISRKRTRISIIATKDY